MEYDDNSKSVKNRNLADALQPYLAIQGNEDGQKGLEETYPGPVLPAAEIRGILDSEMGDKTLTGALYIIRNGL